MPNADQVKKKRGHINSVMYPSGFRVPCTKAEKCGVDSLQDKA